MTQPFTPDDLHLHRRVADIDCCARSNEAACTVRSVDREYDAYVSHIWCFPLDGSAPRQITQGGSDDMPRWSPGGERLAFLSGRSGSPQVHLFARDGGEARQLSHLPQSVSSLCWGPGGEYLVVASAVEVDPDLHGARPGSRQAPPKTGCMPEVAWRLPYKEDGVGYLLQREFHLFSVDASTGRHIQLTDGAFDVLAFDVALDGRIAYSRTRSGRFGHANDLWMCEPDGRATRRLTREHAVVMHPRWSPDGRFIAFAGAIEEGDAEPRLWLVDMEGGGVRALCAESVDVAHPEALFWEHDSKRLVLARAHRGRHEIVALDVADGSFEVLVAGDRQFGVLGWTPSQLAYSIDHPSQPSELWCQGLTPESGPERQLSHLNSWWTERHPIDARAIEFCVPDGRGGTEAIEGWLLRRAGSQGAQPLFEDVHGGPASYALLDYDSNVFWQVLCSRGWSVLALNAVGSASYGREFCRRLAGSWGRIDLPQHVAAVRQLRAAGIADGRNVICGKSYGGYLSAYATGNTDEYAAAVVMAPVGNIETHYGTSDGGYYADPFYMASKPVLDRELARDLSPLTHIEKSVTPTLFMQGKDDERCPKCQSEELFVSLMRSGDTPAELVLYPGETHGFLGSGSPSCRQDAANRIQDWAERFAGTTRSGAPGVRLTGDAAHDGAFDASQGGGTGPAQTKSP